ncbi:MAG: response regulator transcription factor [Deltaproteobacteria bacterium]
MKEIRVLVVDDHAIVRQGIRQLLDNREGVRLVGEASDGLAGLEMVKKLKPDTVILDIALPRLNGLDTAQLIREWNPNITIVMLSMHENETYIRRALSLGARGYVLKTAAPREVIDAILMASQGKYYFSSEVKDEVVKGYLGLSNSQAPSANSAYDTLSEREQQIFRLVVEGNHTKQIASLLCLSPKTVEKHRSNIIRKIGISEPLAMMKYALKIGIVDPELWTN